MIRLLVTIFCLTVASGLHAQTVPIRSGEHNGFTRFVFDIPKDTAWSLEKNATGFDLVFEKSGITADTTNAFSRVFSDRVTKITQTGTTVSFMLACACEPRAYVLRDTMLVIDVLAAPDTADANPLIKEDPKEERIEQTSGPDFEFGDLLWRDRSERVLFQQEPADQTITQSDDQKPADPLLPTSSSLRDQIKKQVAHAATIGLLQPDRVEIEPVKIDRLDPKTAPRPVPQNPAPQANMVFRNSTTVDLEGAPSSLVDSMESIICPSPAELDIASWGNQQSFDTQISNLRANLFEEFDRTSSEVAIELAKTYIFFGFGQEALQSLGMLDKASVPTDNLYALAEILEHGQALSVDPFSSFANCEGPVALWAVLASADPEDEMAENRNSILAALDALPPHLREYLGPLLARRATETGAVELADRALRIAQRASPDPTPEHMLALAEMDVKSQRPEEAIETLTDIVESNSGVSPEAVVQLIETNFHQRSGVTESTVSLVEALAVELGETDLGPSLRRSQTIARAQLGDYETSFQHLGLLAGQDAPELVKSTKEDVLSLLTENASDADFVVHAFDPAAGLVIKDVPLMRAVSGRFATLGFSDIARLGLASIPAGQQTREDKILLSTIALQDRKPREALLYMEGLSDPAAEMLRAQAMELLGDYSSASALFASANQSEASERSAWMAEDWEKLRASETSQFKSAAMALSAQPDEVSQAGMIESGESLLEDSSQLRAALRAIVQPDASN